jgi:hypothetical protein
MKNHIQVVAILHIALGVMSLVAAIVLFSIIGLAGSIVIAQGEEAAAGILGIIAVLLGGFLAITGLPGIIGGWALLTGRNWGRTLVIILGALGLFNFPIGTAVGAYTLWVLLQDPTTPSIPPVMPASPR